MKLAHKDTSKKRYLIASAAVVSAVVLGILAWAYSKDDTTPTSNSETPSAADRGQESVRDQGQSGDTQFNARDNEGQDVDTGAQGISSDSGVITLFSPTQNDIVKNGSTISGLAEASVVNYEIADSSRGLIARGEAKVVNGRFSVTIDSLNPSSSEGSLRVFTVDPDTQKESDHVNVSVKLEP